jgi:YMGG-like Gly-zipper
MKKFLPLLASAALFAACNGKSGADEINLKSSAFQPGEKTEVPAETNAKPRKTTNSRTVKYDTRPVVSQAPQPEQPVQKKKWSKRAKGTVIGAGSGAILGAVIVKKNRPLGAVIGGVVGGGIGYGIGRSMDKKDGRL